LNGADERAARRAIAKATEVPKAAVAITQKDGLADITITGIRRVNQAKEARLLLAIAEDRLTTEVQRGENGGRRLHHSGVVRSLEDVGTFRLENDVLHASKRFNLPQDANVANMKLVVFLQAVGTRRVLGAGSLALQ
jgi:hypothetical protein